MKNAFVIIHFGNKPYILEYEIYTVLMLQKIKTDDQDIVYMYSIIDTPSIFIFVMEKMNIKLRGFDDTYLIELSKKFVSVYERFNTIRTCSFIYANALIEYNKICIVESDIVFFKGFETIFKYKTPAVKFYPEEKNIMNRSDELKNIKITLSESYVKSLCLDKNSMCSPINGGVMLLKPQKNLIKTFKKKIEQVIKFKCSFPNETLIVLLYDHMYNLPINYNLITRTNVIKPIYGYHFSGSNYKHLTIIKDDYIEKIKKYEKKKIVIYFKEKFYNVYHKNIDTIMENIIKVMDNNKNNEKI